MILRALFNVLLVAELQMLRLICSHAAVPATPLMFCFLMLFIPDAVYTSSAISLSDPFFDTERSSAGSQYHYLRGKQYPEFKPQARMDGSARRKGNTGYHMELRYYHVPLLLVHPVHEHARTKGISKSDTVAQNVPDRPGCLVPRNHF